MKPGHFDSAPRSANRRRHPRIVWQRPARLTAANGVAIHAQVRDISFDGLGLLVESCIRYDRVNIHLRLPRGDGHPDQDIVLRCRPVYSAPTFSMDVCHVGMSIDAVESADAVVVLRKYLADQLQHHPERICRQPGSEARPHGAERTVAWVDQAGRLSLHEEDVKPAQDLLVKLSAQVPGALFQYRVCANGHACFPFANQAMNEIYELTPEQVRRDANLVSRYHHPDDAAGILASLKESARTLQPWQHEYRVILPKQGMRWRLGNARPERRADGSILWHGFITDITERKQLEQELERQAQRDYLTGLLNRRQFMELSERELSRAVRYGTPLSVLMLDVDHFKEINDTYGHKVGDRVLQYLSEICQAMLREVDIVGRWGGEEFAVLLPMTSACQAQDTAERLRQSIADAEMHFERETPIRVTVSIGIAPLLGSGVSIDSLLSRADEALYEAKHSGRNCVVL